ncbi:MAG TPA: hypothetical protein VJ979_12045 [Actinomycetota bacterium]|nr:hypothetical protein [Actinomycetota bacterium]
MGELEAGIVELPHGGSLYYELAVRVRSSRCCIPGYAPMDRRIRTFEISSPLLDHAIGATALVGCSMGGSSRSRPTTG